MISDPIVALASAPGRAAIAVVRLSGTGAFGVAARVVKGFQPHPPRTARLSTFRDADGHTIDHGICTAFPAPHSYTGEDLVELTCHGGSVAPARLLAALHEAGARSAAPGEFTRRAVLNGKLDLIQAEAVGDLIDASAPAQAQAALHQIEGGLSRKIESLREQLLELTALMSYDIDFPDEDDGPINTEQLQGLLGQLEREMDGLLATAPAGERLREGALVVLAGRPNSGKSSLFNALLGLDRAIVTAIPGTTRDAIEADTEFDGWPIRLADTAGMHDAEDMIERLGIEVSRRYLDRADLVLVCAEAGQPLEEGARELLSTGRAVLARTKADLLPDRAGDEAIEGIPVSVVSREGLDALRTAVASQVFGGTGAPARLDLEPVLVRERHRVGLARARDALSGARPHLGGSGDAALAAHHVRGALAALDELVGVIDAEAVLGRIFSRFCVGK
ncbi:MAG: tRNA uridine-5-carboxymethylaminomethyl(34) synthesis GTPase MnmE [Gemmatimonadales bacterium]